MHGKLHCKKEPTLSTRNAPIVTLISHSFFLFFSGGHTILAPPPLNQEGVRKYVCPFPYLRGLIQIGYGGTILICKRHHTKNFNLNSLNIFFGLGFFLLFTMISKETHTLKNPTGTTVLLCTSHKNLL